MRSTIKRFLTALLAGVFLFTSGLAYSGNTIVSFATDTATVKALENVFPNGAVIYSDSFPGLKISFDGGDSFVVREGTNDVILKITVLDMALAKKSVPALSTVFGKVELPSHVGMSATLQGNVKGVDINSYINIILNTGNGELYKYIRAVIDNDSKFSIDNYTRFLMAVADAAQQEYDQEQARIYEMAHYTVEPAYQAQNAPSETPDPAPAPAPAPKPTPEPTPTPPPSPAPTPGPSPEPTPTTDPTPEPRQYERVILIYLDGTDLESNSKYGTKNLLDMLRANFSENIKVYVVAGGTTNWHMNDKEYYKEYAKEAFRPNKEWKDLSDNEKAFIESMADDFYNKYHADINGLQLWEVVSADGYNKLEMLQSYDNRYITETGFFAEMIDYSATNTRTDQLDLIIWDHGSGYSGYGADDLLVNYKKEHPDEAGLPDNDFSLKQLRDAFAQSTFIQNGNKFDFIGFDACQMGNYEVVSTLKNFSWYYIGSEENEPGQGWDYLKFMQALSENSNISTQELGKTIINSFIAQYNDGMSTLSFVDMNKVDNLDQAVSTFARALLAEVNSSDTAYYDILTTAGNKSHFATRTGFNNSNYLDLKRFANSIIDKDCFSDELKDSCRKVISALDSCVLENKYLEENAGNGGLSIYFPLSVYYERPYPENTNLSYFNNAATDAIKIYDSVSLNNDYKLTAAKIALVSLAGKLLGYDWKDQRIRTKDDIIYSIKNDEGNGQNWTVIYNAANVDESNPDDPTLKQFERLLADRITREKVHIEVPAEVETNATITITDTNPIVVGDVVDVSVGVFPDRENNSDKYIALGDTPLLSGGKISDDRTVYYNVRAFDNLWYSLNSQICSMYVTSTYEDGSYSGYIPVCYWVDSRSASKIDQGDLSRTEYLKKAAKEDKVTTIYLNVTAAQNNGNTSFTIDGYSEVKNGDVGINNSDTSFLHYRYYELLGGADDLYSITETPAVESIGTFYYDENGVEIVYSYVDDLGFDYSISDAYGLDYYLNDNNLGEGNGLDNYRLVMPEVDPLTWAQSQTEAEKIRGWARQDADRELANAQTSTAAVDNGSSASSSISVASTRSSAAESAATLAPIIVISTGNATSSGETAPAVTEANSDEATPAVDETVSDGSNDASADTNDATVNNDAAPSNVVAPAVTETPSEDTSDASADNDDDSVANNDVSPAPESADSGNAVDTITGAAPANEPAAPTTTDANTDETAPAVDSTNSDESTPAVTAATSDTTDPAVDETSTDESAIANAASDDTTPAITDAVSDDTTNSEASAPDTGTESASDSSSGSDSSDSDGASVPAEDSIPSEPSGAEGLGEAA